MLLQAGVHHADLLRHLGWTGGFVISSSTYSGHFGVTSRPGNGCADHVPILGITFLRIATTNKPGAINPSIFCLFGFIFPKELLLWFVHHMYTGLSNGGRINDSRMVVRSVSVHSPANAALGARTDLRIQALPCLYRITPTPCIDIDFGARPYFFYYSLCINY